MTGTFWDTIVVCTITGLAIASSGVLGMTAESMVGTYEISNSQLVIEAKQGNKVITGQYDIATDGENEITLKDGQTTLVLTPYDGDADRIASGVSQAQIGEDTICGTWQGDDKNIYNFGTDGSFIRDDLVVGSSLTILAFKTVLGSAGGWLVAIGITLFAFSTILGWEYHGEKAFEYILGTHKYNMIYRVIFSLVAYIGATQTLDLVWNLSDIANALMAIPNLICLLLLSGEIARDMKEFQNVIKAEKNA